MAAAPRTPRHVGSALKRLLALVRTTSDNVRAAGSPAGPISDNLESIAAWLYASWYCVLPTPSPAPPVVRGRENMAPALRASMTASTRWQTGWVVIQFQNGVCVAGLGEQTRMLWAGEFANAARPGVPLAPGDAIAAPELVSWVDEPSGFWCAQSPRGAPRDPLVRAYWSVHYDRAGYVLQAVPAALDRAGLRYSLKCPARAEGFRRPDSLVIYLEKADWPKARTIMRTAARALSPHLREDTPPLTDRLARGLSFAEDPGPPHSFGQSRCRALAPAVQELFAAEVYPARRGLTVLTEALRAAGIDPEQPWLNRGGKEPH
jgi:type III HopA1-like effector protein